MGIASSCHAKWKLSTSVVQHFVYFWRKGGVVGGTLYFVRSGTLVFAFLFPPLSPTPIEIGSTKVTVNSVFVFTRESKFQECFQSFVSFLEVIKVAQFLKQTTFHLFHTPLSAVSLFVSMVYQSYCWWLSAICFIDTVLDLSTDEVCGRGWRWRKIRISNPIFMSWMCISRALYEFCPWLFKIQIIC